jgi:hypothetical protein
MNGVNRNLPEISLSE